MLPPTFVALISTLPKSLSCAAAECISRMSASAVEMRAYMLGSLAGNRDCRLILTETPQVERRDVMARCSSRNEICNQFAGHWSERQADVLMPGRVEEILLAR